MKIKDLMEAYNAGDKVRIVPDLYEDEWEAMDESEIRHSFLEEEDLDNEFTVRIMAPDMAKNKLMTPRGDMTIWESFESFYDKDSDDIVNDKIRFWDNDRIVLTMNGSVIDGNHHVIAAIKSGKPIKYIDLME